MKTNTAKQINKSSATKIKSFNYIGLDRKGKKVSGYARGKNASEIKSQLKSEGIIVKKVSRDRKFSFSSKSIKNNDIALFTRQLATMLASGIPLIQSLEVCISSASSPPMAEMLTQIKSSIEQGHSFSEALALYPKHFNNLYRNLLSIGENSGNLDAMLLRVAEHQEKINKLRSKFKKALYYPVAVITVSIAVTAILLIYVVPQFENMFANFNAQLPWFTQIILNLSRWLQANWLYIFISGFGIGYMIRKYVLTRKSAKLALDKFMLNAPIFGDIFTKICLARFTRTLNIMLSSGIPLLRSLPAAATIVDNSVFGEAILKIKEEVESGQSLHIAMENSRVFNHMVIQMTSIGENSGTLDQMLLKVAELYEEDIDNKVDNLSSVIEPIIIVILSIIVGSLIVAMYLPIFTLGSVV